MGAGPGAHGRLTLNGVRTATLAADRPGDYMAQVATTGTGFSTRDALSAQDAAEERVISGMRVLEGVAFAELAVLGLSPDHPKVRSLVDLGLLVGDAKRLRATMNGRRVLDRLTTELALA